MSPICHSNKPLACSFAEPIFIPRYESVTSNFGKIQVSELWSSHELLSGLNFGPVIDGQKVTHISPLCNLYSWTEKNLVINCATPL